MTRVLVHPVTTCAFIYDLHTAYGRTNARYRDRCATAIHSGALSFILPSACLDGVNASPHRHWYPVLLFSGVSGGYTIHRPLVGGLKYNQE